MSVLDRLLDLVYPPRCYGCEEHAEAPGFCPACAAAIRRPSPSGCRRCGQPFATLGGSDRLCGRCLLHPPAFAAVRYCALLDGHDDRDPLRAALHRYKYGREVVLAEGLGRLFASRGIDNHLRASPPDVIVPVPLHRDRLRWRGFNQALLLARRLRNTTGIPVDARVLVRSRPTPPQVALDEGARRQNVAGAFAVANPTAVVDKHVTLVDDVLTTGSTVHECGRTLLRAGAARVDVVVLARAMRH